MLPLIQGLYKYYYKILCSYVPTVFTACMSMHMQQYHHLFCLNTEIHLYVYNNSIQLKDASLKIDLCSSLIFFEDYWKNY